MAHDALVVLGELFMNILNGLLVIVASVISAILYRMGGAHGYDTLYRDIGCSLIATLLIGHLVAWHWTLILVFGLTWGAMSTYWKQVPRAKWYHWIFTGLGYSLATLPIVIVDGCWIGFLIRSIVLAGATMIWSEVNDNAVWEEMGRGAILILTIPILLI